MQRSYASLHLLHDDEAYHVRPVLQVLKVSLCFYRVLQSVETVFAFLDWRHVMLEASDVFKFSHYEVFHICPFC